MDVPKVGFKKPSTKPLGRARFFGESKFTKSWNSSFNDVVKVASFAKTSSLAFVSLGREHFLLSENGDKHSVKVKSSRAICILSDFRKDDKILALGFDDGNLDLVDVSQRRTLSSFAAFTEQPLCLKFSTNSSIHCVSSKRYVSYDFLGSVICEFEFDYPASSAFISSDESVYLASGSALYRLKLTDRSSSLIYESSANIGLISGTQDSWLCFESNGIVNVICCETGAIVSNFRPHLKTISALDISSNGRLVFSASLDGIFSVTEVFSKSRKTLVKAAYPIVAASRRGNDSVLVALSDGTISLYSSLRPASSPVNGQQKTTVASTVVRQLRSYEFSKALILALKSESPKQLHDVVLTLHYNGNLGYSLMRACDLDPNPVIESIAKMAKYPNYLSSVVVLLRALLDQDRVSPLHMSSISTHLQTLVDTENTMISLAAELDLFA